jgi:hypothetical protein
MMKSVVLKFIFFSMIWMLSIHGSGFAQVTITHKVQDDILYTLYSPDTTILVHNIIDSGSIVSMYIDLNNDGIFDIKFAVGVQDIWDYSYGYPDLQINDVNLTFLDTNSQVAWNDSAYIILGFVNGDTITNSLIWNHLGYIDEYYGQQGGVFETDKQPYGYYYYPIKFFLQGDYYFGWLKISSDYYHITLKETAICLIPNQPIYTGHKGLYFPNSPEILHPPISIQQVVVFPNFIIYPNSSFYGEYSIEIPNDIASSNDILLTVYDDTGRMILKNDLTDNPNIATFYLTGKSKGLYLVQLSNGSKSYYGKVVKE